MNFSKVHPGKMEQSSVTPNHISHASVVKACALAGDLQEAVKWSKVAQPDTMTQNTVLAAFARAGKAREAATWFEGMSSATAQPDAHSYAIVVNACARAKQADLAAKWIGKMEAAGFSPNCVTYSSVVNACAQAQLPGEAAAWIQKMEEAGARLMRWHRVTAHGTLCVFLGSPSTDNRDCGPNHLKQISREETAFAHAHAVLAPCFAFTHDHVTLFSSRNLRISSHGPVLRHAMQFNLFPLLSVITRWLIGGSLFNMFFVRFSFSRRLWLCQPLLFQSYRCYHLDQLLSDLSIGCTLHDSRTIPSVLFGADSVSTISRAFPFDMSHSTAPRK